KEQIGCVCKWTFRKFSSYLLFGVGGMVRWPISKVILTLLAVTPLPAASDCFELFGFDTLTDDKFKPWLLEINYSPELCLDCSTDDTVERKLLHGTVVLLYYMQIDILRQNRFGKPWIKAGRRWMPWITASESATEETPGFLACKTVATYTDASSIQPALQDTGGSIQKVATLTGKIARAHRKMLTSQLQERMINPKTPSQAKPETKNNQFPAGHSAHISAQLSHWTPTSDFCSYRFIICPYISDKKTSPIPHVGDFVLFFPFNKAALQASRERTDIKDNKEINKLVSSSYHLNSRTQRVGYLTSV
ncbi:LOW QUALITY PROTEIN: putative tubulin polyglutamylase TTLL2, partial [Amazona ochrocephala]